MTYQEYEISKMQVIIAALESSGSNAATLTGARLLLRWLQR